MLESVQFHAAVTCSGAFPTTKRTTLTEQELGWQSLSDRRKANKLVTMHKIVNGVVPTYLSDILVNLCGKEEGTRRYNTRCCVNLRVPRCRTERFKRSFFPSSISLWNDLPVSISNAKTLQAFKHSISSFLPPPSKPPPWFSVGRRLPNVLHTRLRLNNSSLNSDRYKINLSDTASCECGALVENNLHFLLHCANHGHARLSLLRAVRNIVAPGITPATLPALSEEYFTNMILNGSVDLSAEDNTKIFHALQTFLIVSGRFRIHL